METDLKSEFTAQGINQTLHRVYLEVKCRVNILTPFQDIEKEIKLLDDYKTSIWAQCKFHKKCRFLLQ